MAPSSPVAPADLGGEGNPELDLTEETYRYTSAPERRDRLTQFVAERGYCTIAELSEFFAVSEMTIRRDVLRLVEQGKVRSFRGAVGAVSRSDDGQSALADFPDIMMGDAKRAIARRAVAMVTPGSIIAIDAGTTTNQVAAHLGVDRGVKVVTHSFPVAATLAGNPGVELNLLGGVLNRDSMSFIGPSVLDAISSVQVQTLFLSAGGVNERGAFCSGSFAKITKRALIDVSEQVVLLADSTKFYSPAMIKICDWSDIDAIIVDDRISEEQQRMLEQQDVGLVLAHIEESDALPLNAARFGASLPS